MCLVSYIPTSNGYILNSNRDEAPSRNSLAVQKEEFKDTTLYYPADTKGGSWIFTSIRGLTVCLLNGALENHKHKPPYRLSRGLVLKAIFEYDHPIDYIQQYNFQNIEPFTMVIAFNKLCLEFRWDGELKHVIRLDSKIPHVWSSCTLYTPTQQIERERWFFELLESTPTTPENLKNLHLTGGNDNLDYGFRMNRENRVATISFTQVTMKKQTTKFEHYDLLTAHSNKLKFTQI